MIESTNLQQTDLAPTTPVYPQVCQVLRVYGSSMSGTNVYPAYIEQQVAPNLQLRDREQVYLWEPNGTVLNEAYYTGRLVGSYAGLPLFVTYETSQASIPSVATFTDFDWTFVASTLVFDIGTTFLVNGPTTFSSTSTTTFNGTVIINAPYEVCGQQFWCCGNDTLGSASVSDYVPPAKTVIDLTAPLGGSTLSTIIPANFNGSAGPQLLVFRCVSHPIVIPDSASSGGGGFGILLPPTYGSSVTLQEDDCIGLWYDTCSSTLWGVLWCTVDVDSGGGGVTPNQGQIALLIGSQALTTSFANVVDGVGGSGTQQQVLTKAGTYQLSYLIIASNTMTADSITVHLYDSTAAAAVPLSEYVVNWNLLTTGVSYFQLPALQYTTGAANHTVVLRAKDSNALSADTLVAGTWWNFNQIA